MNTESIRKCVAASQALTEALAMASVTNMGCGWFRSLTASMKESGALQKRLETMLQTATAIRKCDVCKDEIDGDGLFCFVLDHNGEQLLCKSCANEARFGLEDDQNTCTRCGSKENVDTRYSFGVYAGRLCLKCCRKYRDRCGTGGASQGDPRDLDEAYEEDI